MKKFQNFTKEKQRFFQSLGSLKITRQQETEALALCAGGEVYHHTLQEADWKLKQTCPRFYRTIEDRLGFVQLPKNRNNFSFLKKLPQARKLFYLGATPIYTVFWEWPLEDNLNSHLIELNRYIWKPELTTRDLALFFSDYTEDYGKKYLINKNKFTDEIEAKLVNQTEALLINVYKQAQLD